MPPRYVNNRGKLVPVSVYTVCKVYSATCPNITENESSENNENTLLTNIKIPLKPERFSLPLISVSGLLFVDPFRGNIVFRENCFS